MAFDFPDDKGKGKGGDAPEPKAEDKGPLDEKPGDEPEGEGKPGEEGEPDPALVDEHGDGDCKEFDERRRSISMTGRMARILIRLKWIRVRERWEKMVRKALGH